MNVMCWNHMPPWQRLRVQTLGTPTFDHASWDDPPQYSTPARFHPRCDNPAVVGIEWLGELNTGPRLYCFPCAVEDLIGDMSVLPT